MLGESAIRWPVLILTFAVMALAFLGGQRRLEVDTDITSMVPDGDRAISKVKTVFARHPALDRVVVDLSMRDGRADAQALTEAADELVAMLERSGLFSSVGTPARYTSVSTHLPVLFSSEQLERDVAPRMTPYAIDRRLADIAASLTNLQGVGTPSRISNDPLGLSDLVLARLGALTPTDDAHVSRGHVLKNDGRHLLVTAIPSSTAMDTILAHAIHELLRHVQDKFRKAKGREPGADVIVTGVGGFRAAIDSERMIKQDAKFAITLATLGIVLLLLLCFPRPWLGIFALLPAMAGGCMALFAYSLVESSISAFGLWFGGVLLSITVNQGAIYLLLIDRESRTRGRHAAHEAFRIGSLSTIVSIGSFLALKFSGFEGLGQLGLFTALGIGFSFLFVHLVFPSIFPSAPPVCRPAWLLIDRWLRPLAVGRGCRTLALAGVVFLVAIVLSKPRFWVDPGANNSVGRQAARAETQVKDVWGDLFAAGYVYVLIDATDQEDFWRRSDRWLLLLEQQKSQGAIARGFSPSMLTPGREVAKAQGAAWTAFWTPGRRAVLERSLRESAERHGFSGDAFSPFLAQVRSPSSASVPLPNGAMALYGTGPGQDGKGLSWLGNVTKGPAYDACAFALQADRAGLLSFDGVHFSEMRADYLASSFNRMLLLIVAFVTICVLLFFLNIRVAAVALAPLVFAFVCSLAALKLLGHPIDVPGLLLPVFVFGVGVDYSFSLVRVYQSSLGEHHPCHGPVRIRAFLAFTATLVAMLALTTAQHPVVRSAGVTGSVAIAFCAIGSFVILPPVLRRMYGTRPLPPANPTEPKAWVMSRFRRLSAYLRLYAWFKLRLDPMFPRLHQLVPAEGTLLDIGCGYGIPAAWLLAQSDRRRVVGIESDEERARTARWVLGERGDVYEGVAPEVWGPDRVDTILCLDMVHYLDDRQLEKLFSRARDGLAPGGKLVMRATVPINDRPTFHRWIETQRLALRGYRARFRSVVSLREKLERTGFRMVMNEPTAPGREEVWLLAERAEE